MGFLAANFKRALGTLARRWMVEGLGVLILVLLFSPHLFISLYHLAGDLLASKPQATSQGGSTSNSELLTPNLAKVVPPTALAHIKSHQEPKLLAASTPTVVESTVPPPWVNEGTAFASEFGERFYGVNPHNWSDTQDYFFDHFDHDKLETMVHQYFGREFNRELEEQNLTLTLRKPACEFLRMEGDLGVFLFAGTQTKALDGTAPATRSVGLVLWIQPHPQGKSLVEKARDVSPDFQGAGAGDADFPKEMKAETAANGTAKGDLSPVAGAAAGDSAKGEDPLKAVSDGVKDVQGAVSTANDAKAATDKAKGILGF